MQPFRNPIKIEKIYGIGTYWYFEFFEEINKESVQSEIQNIISEFEDNYSRFKDTSFISILNDQRHLENPSDELIEILTLGIEFYKNSNGIFNMGIGEVLENRGYDKNYSFINKSEGKSIPRLDKLIDINDDKITLRGKGRIDLGGFGKGFLIDKLANHFIDQLNLEYFLINGGGDLYVTSDNEMPIEILLQSPIDPTKFFNTVKLRNSSLCASTTFKRRWKDQNGKVQTHVVKTDKKVEELACTFVIASKAVVADAMATVMMMAYKTDLREKIIKEYDIKFLAMNENTETLDEYKFFN